MTPPKSHASLRLYASTRRTDTDKNAFSIAHRWGLIATAVNCRCYLPEIPHPLRLHEAKRASQCCHAGTYVAVHFCPFYSQQSGKAGKKEFVFHGKVEKVDANAKPLPLTMRIFLAG